MIMANLGDLSKMPGAVQTQTTTKDSIDLSKGKKLERNGNYVTPEQARAIREKEAEKDKEIFDTPPSVKIDPNMPVSASEETTNKGRTPIKPGKPSDESPKQEKKQEVTADQTAEEVRPAGLHVANNFVSKVDFNKLEAFDISSIPARPQKQSENEEYAMNNLNAAVEREKKSITERIQDLTQKQYEEYLDARAAGRPIPRPETTEETEAKIQAEVEAKDNVEEVVNDPNESSTVNKRIKIMDDDDNATISVEKINSDRLNSLIQSVNSAISIVFKHTMSNDYFERAIRTRALLIDQYNIYSEIWVIAMYDKNKKVAVHPFVVVKKFDIELCAECNIENIMGVHVLEDNDTIEKVYTHLYNTGALYDYIDYLDGCVVFKLPIDQFDKDTAIKMANDIIGGNQMSKNTNKVTEKEDKELDAAVKADEAATLNEVVKETATDEPKVVVKYAEEEAQDYTELNLDPPEVLYEEPKEGLTDEGMAVIKQFASAYEEEKPERQVTLKEAEPLPSYMQDSAEREVVPREWKNTDMYLKEEDPISTALNENKEVAQDEEEEKVTLTRQYEGDAAYDLATSDDLKKDLEDEINENVDDDDDEKMLEELRTAVKENMPSIKNRINLRDFKIGSTPIAASKIAGFSIKDVNQADWILPNAKRVIEVRGLSGPELFSMNPQNSTKNRINTFRQIYGIIYRHIVSKKPKSFDEWLKVTRFSDIDHIYAALHRATFMDSNFTHYECPECKHVFIKDHKWEDMVVYADEKTKKQMEALYNSGDTSIADYEVELTQISDDYVIGLKDPSVWNMVMETSALSEEFLNKYEDLLDTMSFIDSIYVINRDSNTLDPVDFGYDAENPAKSTARKITILSDIIRTLSSDAYFDLRNKIATKFVSSTALSYQIPAADCPKCKHHFDPERVDAMQLLFTRHQLGAVGVISTTV